MVQGKSEKALGLLQQEVKVSCPKPLRYIVIHMKALKDHFNPDNLPKKGDCWHLGGQYGSADLEGYSHHLQLF